MSATAVAFERARSMVGLNRFGLSGLLKSRKTTRDRARAPWLGSCRLASLLSGKLPGGGYSTGTARTLPKTSMPPACHICPSIPTTPTIRSPSGGRLSLAVVLEAQGPCLGRLPIRTMNTCDVEVRQSPPEMARNLPLASRCIP